MLEDACVVEVKTSVSVYVLNNMVENMKIESARELQLI